MQIVKTTRFLIELEVVLDFIARDNLFQALTFSDKLDEMIYQLTDMPYSHRKSLKANDVHIRDLVFNGYVVPYRINISKNRLEIIGIFSSNEWNV
jgi:plasmid stabilization system protein ParE